jgi:hypothetical protein
VHNRVRKTSAQQPEWEVPVVAPSSGIVQLVACGCAASTDFDAKLRKDPRDRRELVFGGEMQIATSTYHAYNHGLVLTGRMTF